MEINNIELNEYYKIFNINNHIYNSKNFVELNKHKCEEILCLVFFKNKIKLGIVFGLKNNILYSPFSSPFGAFDANYYDISIEEINESLNSLINFAKENKYNLKITLPPQFYNELFYNKLIFCLFNSDFSLDFVDINHFFKLSKMDNYHNNIWNNAKKNLNKSFKNNLIFKKSNSVEENIQAYEVIKKNRISKGYPLKLTFNDIIDTSEFINSDFFYVLYENIMIASALIFYINSNILQVIYWGDLIDFNYLRPMNFLSYKIFDFFKNSEIEIVDIGPSSEFGKPNLGLCSFKESIGCQISNKYTFKYEN